MLAMILTEPHKPLQEQEISLPTLQSNELLIGSINLSKRLIDILLDSIFQLSKF